MISDELEIGAVYRINMQVPSYFKVTFYKQIQHTKNKKVVRTTNVVKGMYLGDEHLGECLIDIVRLQEKVSDIVTLSAFIERRIKNLELKTNRKFYELRRKYNI